MYKAITNALLLLLLPVASIACSCRGHIVERDAQDIEFIFKAEIISSSPSDQKGWRGQPTIQHRIKVLENTKGVFNQSIIVSDAQVEPDACGVDIQSGKSYYFFMSTPTSGASSFASRCNTWKADPIGKDKYMDEMAAYLKSPHPELSPVNTNSWRRVDKVGSKSMYADLKHIERDDYGTYVWTIKNDPKAERKKSIKNLVEITCTDKMFSIGKEYAFSDVDAKGKVLELNSNLPYKWRPFSEDVGVKKIYEMVCHK
jgi:hypothetical protein